MDFKNIIRNPIYLMIIAFAGSAPAFIYTFFVDVYGWSDLPWWGVISACMIPAVLLWYVYLVIEGFIRGKKRNKKK